MEHKKFRLEQSIKMKKFSEKGLSLLEALVSTAIIGIGFVANFQMVQYSVRSIDVSGERTKSNLLISMVAEDLISEKINNKPQKSNEIPKIKSRIKVERKENGKDFGNTLQEKTIANKDRLSQKSSKLVKKTIFNPQPYRIILRLSGANPSAPAETVTEALRKAGVQFEVEKIERFDEENFSKNTSMKR